MRLTELVNQHYRELSSNDLYIWDYIQAHGKEYQNLSIVELAQRCHISKTTILRSTQKLSLKRYSELKVYLSWENRPFGDMVIDEYLTEHVCDTSKYAIDKLRERDFTDICEILYHFGCIFVYGTRALQDSMTRGLQRMFLYCEEFVYVLSGRKGTEMVLPFLSRDDVVIPTSLREEGELINEFASQFHPRSIKMISMTRPKNNELTHKYTKGIYITTSQVMTSNHTLHETADLYFVLAELPFPCHSRYKQRQSGIETR